MTPVTTEFAPMVTCLPIWAPAKVVRRYVDGEGWVSVA